MHQRQGKQAEDKVATLLKQTGHRILAQNWKVKSAEIDIITTKKNFLYIVEVKYRQNNALGQGYDYVTPIKLKRLERAALLFLTSNRKYSDLQAIILVASVQGPDFVTELFEVA